MGERGRDVFVHRCSDSSQGLAWRVLPFFNLSQSKAYGGAFLYFILTFRKLILYSDLCRSHSWADGRKVFHEG
jgi:hypothetical protein